MRNFYKKGFTLIELLVTITIIGILAVGGIQIYTEQLKKNLDTTNIKNLKIVDMGIQQYILDNGIAIQLNEGTTLANKGFTPQNAIYFKNSIRIYVPNIDNLKHSASNKFCDTMFNGCGYRYTDKINSDELNYIPCLKQKPHI